MTRTQILDRTFVYTRECASLLLFQRRFEVGKVWQFYLNNEIGKLVKLTMIAGEISTALITEFEDIDGKGHGAKVMGIAMSVS